MAARRLSLLERLERQLMHVFGPPDVRDPNSRRPEPPPTVFGEVVQGEFERTDMPSASAREDVGADGPDPRPGADPGPGAGTRR